MKQMKQGNVLLQYVSVKNTKFAVYYERYKFLDKKKFPPFVLIHGFTGSALYHFKHELKRYPELFKTDIIALDLRGHGNSDLGTDDYQALPVDIFFTDMEAILDELALKEIILLGVSFGGMLANRYAIKYPDRVKKLIIISSTGVSSLGMKNALTFIQQALSQFINAQYKIETLEPATRRLISLMLKVHNTSPPYEKLAFLKYFADQFVCREWSILTQVKENIICPVLLIHGENDYIELENVKSLHKHYQQSFLHVLPGLGHLPQLKDPLLVQKCIYQFLIEQSITILSNKL